MHIYVCSPIRMTIQLEQKLSTIGCGLKPIFSLEINLRLLSNMEAMLKICVDLPVDNINVSSW